MQFCHCIKGEGRFRLKVESFDCQHLWITDRSEWQVEGLYTVPESYEIKVVLPGSKSEKSFIIKTGTENRIKVSDATFLNDGLYCFGTESCQYQHKIYRAITCKLECCLRELISKANPGDKQIEELIIRARIWLDKIHMSAEAGDKEVALKTLSMLKAELRTMNCNC